MNLRDVASATRRLFAVALLLGGALLGALRAHCRRPVLLTFPPPNILLHSPPRALYAASFSAAANSGVCSVMVMLVFDRCDLIDLYGDFSCFLSSDVTFGAPMDPRNLYPPTSRKVTPAGLVRFSSLAPPQFVPLFEAPLLVPPHLLCLLGFLLQ